MKRFALPAALGLGVVFGSPALASKPPLERLPSGPRVEPLAFAALSRTPDGRVALVGDWIAYSGGLQTRDALIDVVAFDSFGRNFGPFSLAPGDDRGDGQPMGPGSGYFDAASGTRIYCPSPYCWDDSPGRWFFGSAYHNPNTVEDMQTIDGPLGGIVDEIDAGFFWNPPAPEHCYLVYFMFEDVLAFDTGTGFCNDPAWFTMTPGDVGVAIDLGILPPMTGQYYWTAIKGLGVVGMTFPINDLHGDGHPDGSYQMIIAKDINIAMGLITLATGPTQPMLWSTGDNGGLPGRPGANNADSYDDDAPTNFRFEPQECYDYSGSFGGCADHLSKMNSFAWLGCPSDFNGDGFVDGIDADLFENAFVSPGWNHYTDDLNGDCFVDGIDYDRFYNQWLTGC